MKPLRIQQLSALVANQIAAGEVIERPASVVKELLENALDAGASVIHVDIGYGGLNQIKISDNGCGIDAEDLPLAIAAHATSKIRHLNDLYAISSMGFRGEALASIAAVSKLSILSKPEHQNHAMMLQVNGGLMPTLSACARSEGTTVEVLDLFFNAPVRKKFLKSPRSEYLAIEMVVKRFALSMPSIAITLSHHGKQMFGLPAALCDKTKLLRIQKLLGKEFTEQAIKIDIEQGGLRLQGWVSGESYQRSQNDKQWVYINQRMVKDKLVFQAIRQAYDQLLHPGRYPACLLYLDMDPSALDVNVHPTKHEVRFEQPRLVHDFIVSHLTDVLRSSKEDKPIEKVENYTSISLPSMKIAEAYIKYPLKQKTEFEPRLQHQWLILNQHYGLLFLQAQPYLVHMIKAHQQALFYQLKQQTFPLAHRPLLVPVRVAVDKKNYLSLEQARPLWAELGIQLDWVSETELVVRTIPILFPQLDIKKCIHLYSTLAQNFANSSRDAGGLPNVQDYSSEIDRTGSSEQMAGHWQLNRQQILKQWVECQSFDAYQLTADDLSYLADYAQQQIQSAVITPPWCLHLDLKACDEYLGVASMGASYV